MMGSRGVQLVTTANDEEERKDHHRHLITGCTRRDRRYVSHLEHTTYGLATTIPQSLRDILPWWPNTAQYSELDSQILYEAHMQSLELY